MAMLAPELTTEVPERLHVEAESGDDRLALVFRSRTSSRSRSRREGLGRDGD